MYYNYRLEFYDPHYEFGTELLCYKFFRSKSEAESELARAKKAGLSVRLTSINRTINQTIAY